MWEGNTVECIILAENANTTKGIIFDDKEPIWNLIVIYHKYWNNFSKSYHKDAPLREASQASDDL